MRKITEQCRKSKVCFECGAINGNVRKAGTYSLRISHDKFKAFNSSTSAKKVAPVEKVKFDASFEDARRRNSELEKHLKKAMDDLNPLRVLKLFRRIRVPDLELLGLRTTRPESFLWQQVPAPPVCIRPSVGQEGASTEDDITAKLGDIIAANTQLRESLQRGVPVSNLIEHWDFLSLQVAMYVNSDVPGLQKAEYGKPIRSFVQRLKGKQGRFRGNLSGKRVDYSSRTVISPDPNLRIDEVAVPVHVAKILTYPERVNKLNIGRLRDRVRNGSRWPGAVCVHSVGEGYRLYPKYGNPIQIASKLKVGDVVDRHLEDGDIVLFNRQPSLHKLSILAHYVKVYPHRTFRLNECDCVPYNADFDGDEMNLHVPQTEEAKTEAMQLMGVKHNIVTPKNGEPIISAIQDFVTASYLLSNLDHFYDKKSFVATCVGMLEPDTPFDIPSPAILKPEMLWTGKQVFNVLMRPSRLSNIRVNIDAHCRNFRKYYELLHNDLQDDSFLCIRNSEVMCGRMDKSTIGAGKKSSLFYVMYRDFGADAAAQAMNRLSKLCARWLSNQGFSVGISDVTPPPLLTDVKKEMVTRVFSDYIRFSQESKAGKLRRRAGLDDSETLEQEQVRVLSTVRTDISSVLTSQLSRKNSPMIMAMSGSKGSNVNVAQMAALLGQQDIEGKRVADGFQDRTLPHFAKHEGSAPSKGFVSNSFFSGLNPSEFFFHAIGGRVGLVDTAVKTAETGYMSRRLMKSLEDLSTQYDRTVRNSSANVVQFRFGDDDLDPVDMEASAKPVDFERTYSHIEATTFNIEDIGLNTDQILRLTEDMLSKHAPGFPGGVSTAGKSSADAAGEQLIDQHQSTRVFLESIREFVNAKAASYDQIRSNKQVYGIASSFLPDLGNISRPEKRKSDVLLEDEPIELSRGSSTLRSGRSSETRTTNKVAGRNSTSKNKKRKSMANSLNDVAKVSCQPSTKDRFELTCKISEKTLRTFLQSCLEKYERARVEPGHAVGAVGAQSIGEPGTQMTLKTFHFAGVAGMSLTAGVPRIKEIINASKDISTPVITCRLERRNDLSIPESLARIVKGRIESLCLEDVTSYIQISHALNRPSWIYIRISLDTILELGLDLTAQDICSRIQKHRKFKGSEIKISVKGNDEIKLSVDQPLKSIKRGAKDETSTKERMLRLQLLRRFLPTIQILGHPQATRAVVMAEDDPMSNEIKAKKQQVTLVEGSLNKIGVVPVTVDEVKIESGALIDATPESNQTRPKPRNRKSKVSVKGAVKSASVVKTEEDDVKTGSNVQPPQSDYISSERPIQMHKVMVEGYGLRYCMNTDGVDPYRTQTNSVIETFQILGIEAARSKIISEIAEVTKDLSIDPRHMALLADVMTYKGEVLGITRFGLAKMRDSVLQLASFEKTADHVFEAGVNGKVDRIEGVSECVIVGNTMGIGTGSVEVVRGMNFQPGEVQARRAIFEEAWETT